MKKPTKPSGSIAAAVAPTPAAAPTSVKNNFKFTDLFKNFPVSDIDDFVFDDVDLSINLNEVSFSGNLRLDGRLSIFKKFLFQAIPSQSAIPISGTIKTDATSLDKLIKPTGFVLKSTLPFFVEIFDGVTLSKVFFQITVDYVSKKWTIAPQLSGEFDIDGVTNGHQATLTALVSEADQVLSLSATDAHMVGGFGIPGLTLEEVEVKGVLTGKNKVVKVKTLDFEAKLTAGARTFDFEGEVSKDATGILATANAFNVDILSTIFNELVPSGFTMPDFDIAFKNCFLSVATGKMTIDGHDITAGLNLFGEVTVHDHTFDTTAAISSSGIVFDGSLGDLKFGVVDLKKTELDFQLYKKSLNKPAKFEIYGEAEIKGVTLDCGVYFEKNTTFTTVLYARMKAHDFRLSSVFSEVKGSFVDTLSFSELGFIYASASTQTQNEGFAFQVQEGLQLMGKLEEIPALSTITKNKHVGLVFSAHFGSNTNIGIAIPDTQLDLGSSIKTDPIKIQIDITPEPAFNLIFGMDVTVPNQTTPLHFDMKLELKVEEASASVTMKNWWKTPFGIHGLKIGPHAAVEVGIIYATFPEIGPSTFGIAGGLAIGNTIVEMAVKISENPMEEILVGKLDNLKPAQLINFATQMIPLNIPTTPNFFEIKKLELYCAPAGGTIGTIVYKPGFSFSGDIVIAGKEIQAYTRISDTAIVAKGMLDNMTLGPLTIKGEKGKNAKVDMEISTEKQSLMIDGAFDFLGLEEGLYVDISNYGVHFKFEQNFADKLTFEIQGDSTGKLSKPETMNFKLSGAMQNDIVDYLKTTVTQKINDTTKATDTKIDTAQKKVDAAKKTFDAAVQKAQQDLDNAKAKADDLLKKETDNLNAVKDSWNQKISDAQGKLDQAKATYDRVFQAAQDKVNQTQQAYNDGVNAAKTKLDQAQRTYNNGISAAQDKVNSTQRAWDNSMGAAQRKVDNAQRKVDGMSRWNPGRYIAEGALEAAKLYLKAVQYGTDYTAFEGAKAALQTAKTGANYTAFLAAQKALDAAKVGANYTAFNAAKATLEAVRYGSEYTAWQAAEKTLSTVKVAGSAAITEAQTTLNHIGASAEYVALEAAKTALKAVQTGTDYIAFDGAKKALTAAKAGADTVLKLEKLIAQHVGDFFNVKSFKFNGSLKKIEAGDFFNAQLVVTILKTDYNWKIDFNVKDVTGFIDDLFDKAWKELKSLV